MKYYILLFTIIALSACVNNKLSEQETEPTISDNIIILTTEQLRNASIEVARAEQKMLPGKLRLNGHVDLPPQNTAAVSAPFGGYLKQTRLVTGMFVKRGEIIAYVQDQQYIQLQQDYLTTKYKLQYLKQDFERETELAEARATSNKNQQLSQSEYKINTALLQSLAKKLELAGLNPSEVTEGTISSIVPLRAPISGYVSAVYVMPGKYVQPTDVLFELVDPSSMNLVLKVFEKDVAQLALGQKIVAFTNNNNKRRYNAEVSFIGKTLATDRSTGVLCRFNGAYDDLVAGTYMNAEIDVNTSSTAIIPEESIVNFKGKNYLFVQLDATRYRMQIADVGVRQNGYVQLLSSSYADTNRYVTKGAYTLLMALKNQAE